MTKEQIQKIVDKYNSCFYDVEENKIDCANSEERDAIQKELGLDDTHVGGSEVDGYYIWDVLKEEVEESLTEENDTLIYEVDSNFVNRCEEINKAEHNETMSEQIGTYDDGCYVYFDAFDEKDGGYCQYVLYDKEGHELGFTDPLNEDEVIDEFELDDNHKLIVKVKEVEESLTEAEEDELSDDELDALDAEEEKAFKQKQADRRARVAGKRKEKSDKEAKLAELKKKLGSDYDFDKLFDALVPDTGVANTIAGELVRALNRVDFRDFNDGEIFYEGDGLDSAGSSMAFVADFFSDRFNDSEDTDTAAEDIYNEIINMAEDKLTDSAYRTQLYDLEKQVVNWIKNHEELLVEPNTEDSLRKFKGEEYWADYIPSYDIEDVSLPKNVEELLDLGEIDDDDIIWAVQDMIQGMGNSTNDVTYDGYGITVRGLSKADYDELGGDQGAELYDWLEKWAQDEYGDPDEIRARKEEEERAEAEEEEDEEGSEEETDEGLEEELEAGDCAYYPERDEYYYLKKTDKPNKFELFTHSDSRGFEVASPRFIDKNSPFYNKLKLYTKNANPEFKESVDNCNSESYNDKELKEDASVDLRQKLEPLYNEGKVYFDIVEKQNGGDFLIIEDWESLFAIEKALKPEFEPKDGYDTSVLDELDIDYGFSDEWGRCDNCGKLIRLEADSAHWVPDFFYDGNGLCCGNCVRENPEAYIAWLLEQPTDRANTILDNGALENAGFHKIDGNYENGWYDRHDSPEEILNKAYEEHPEAEFIFSISGVGKWAVQFELWMRGE